MRISRIIGCLFLCISFILTGCGSSFQLTMSDASMIKVGSESMGEKQAKLLLMNMKCNFEKQYVESYGSDFWNNEMESGYSFEEFFLDNDYLNEMCALLFIREQANEAEIELTEEEEVKVKKAASAYFSQLADDEKEYAGVRQSDVEKLYENYLLAEKWIMEAADDVPREVSEEEARIVQIKQIYVTDAKTAEEVWNQAVLGANFDSLAAVYNKSEEYICFVSRGDREKKVSQKLFDMKNGEISDILEENGGYYIVLCVNSYEKERTQQNKESVYRQNVYDCWHDIYRENIKNEKISINKRLWNRIDLSYNENITTDTLFDVYEEYIPD